MSLTALRVRIGLQVFPPSVLVNIETFDDLMTYLLEEFHVRVWRASCKVEAISGNNSSNVSRDPEIKILSPGGRGGEGDGLEDRTMLKM